MDVIWRYEEGSITFTEIRNEPGETDRAADPIRTMVRRLHQKGVLRQETRDACCYTPTVFRDQYMEARTSDLLGWVYGENVKGLISALMHYEHVEEAELET